MSVSASFSKYEGEVLDYQINWTEWLNGDTISSSSWTLDPGITEGSAANTTTTTTIWVSGGTAGERYTLRNTIVTAAGRTGVREIELFVSIRAGMVELVEYVRANANAGINDKTVGGITYWTDKQIQDVLDKYRQTWKQVPLHEVSEYVNGSYTYTEYRIPPPVRHFERGGTALTGGGWSVRSGAGSAAPSYTPNYDAGVITFAADTGGSAYYLNCRTYDVYQAVADVWEAKAGHEAASFDWSSDNHSVKMSQVRDAYMGQARYWRNMAGGARRVTLHRTDENPDYSMMDIEPDNNPPRSWGW